MFRNFLNDKINKDLLKSLITKEYSDFSVYVYDSIDSTNIAAKKLALNNNAPEGTLIAADMQTSGKGSNGRSFYSPSDSGLYFSVVLRPDIAPEKASYITTAAAVAVCGAIEAVTGKTALIKWVNDIYVNRKKVCGILTESAFSPDGFSLVYAVLGIGVNVYPPEGGFPKEISNIAGSLEEDRILGLKTRLLAECYNRFMGYYKNIDNAPHLGEYKKRSFLIGRRVYFIKNSFEHSGVVLDIDSDFSLVIEDDNKKIERLSSGSVSLIKRNFFD